MFEELTHQNLWKMRTAKAVFIQQFVMNYFANVAKKYFEYCQLHINYLTRIQLMDGSVPTTDYCKGEYIYAFKSGEKAWQLMTVHSTEKAEN